MKIIRENGKIVAYRHWFRWYRSPYFENEFINYNYKQPKD